MRKEIFERAEEDDLGYTGDDSGIAQGLATLTESGIVLEDHRNGNLSHRISPKFLDDVSKEASNMQRALNNVLTHRS